jgi:hypothetical protein
METRSIARCRSCYLPLPSTLCRALLSPGKVFQILLFSGILRQLRHAYLLTLWSSASLVLSECCLRQHLSGLSIFEGVSTVGYVFRTLSLKSSRTSI